MDPTLRTRLRELLPRLREELGVRRLAVFGSRARGTEHEDSDVDVLIDFEGGATLHAFVAARALLEAAVGRPVDLTTPGGLHPLLKDRILAEAVDVS